MRPLMIVIVDPMLQTLDRIGKGSKDRFLQKLPPEGFPKTLDLAQCHRVVWGATDVTDALLFELLLEATLASP